jgi:hypothetical protein
MKRTFEPPPPEPDADADVAHAAGVMFDLALGRWDRQPFMRKTGVQIVLERWYANFDGTPENANLPNPDRVWSALQELLPRNVVLRVEPYVPGASGQTATLTWRE